MSTKASIAPRLTAGTEADMDTSQKTNFASPKVTQIITSKEWVLPPRPKPGRKPSVDTPLSKRKAQNRAAQRAFRERRATRVQELEAKLIDVERENEIKEMGLINTLNKLKIENQFLLKSLNQLKKENHQLKNSNNNAQLSSNPSPLHGASPSSYISPAPSISYRSPPDNSYSPRNMSMLHTSNEKSILNSPPMSNDSNFDCGVCTKEECLCEEVGLKDLKHSLSISNLTHNNHQQEEAEKMLQQQLNSFKPTKPVALKKRKASEKDGKDEELFVDFTNKFKSKPMPDLKKLKRNHDPVDKASVEDCGFCTDDSNCVCLAAANEAAKLSHTMESDNVDESESTLPPLYNYNVRNDSLPVLHPGPSVRVSALTNYGDLTPGTAPRVDSPLRTTQSTPLNDRIEKIKESADEDGGCTGNPGTCKQCQTDPMSTLFCTTVANKEKEEEVIENEPKPTPVPVLETSSMYIPCSDAYKTLSRHKKFNTVDFSTVVGKLTTRGMQVEVQSVANVLRELDRNFSK